MSARRPLFIRACLNIYKYTSSVESSIIALFSPLFFSSRRDLHTRYSRKRARLPTYIHARHFYSDISRDFKFLPLYVSSDVCRREVAQRRGRRGLEISTRAEKPFREIRIARRGHGATFGSNPSTGNTLSFRDTRFSALRISGCNSAPGGKYRRALIPSHAQETKRRRRHSSCVEGAMTRTRSRANYTAIFLYARCVRILI